jgi:hypothetical protein
MCTKTSQLDKQPRGQLGDDTLQWRDRARANITALSDANVERWYWQFEQETFWHVIVD